MIATIVVEGLQVSGVIGVDQWERSVRQQLWIDVRLEVDIAAAVAEDDVSKALDYGALSNLIAAEVEGCDFQLLESLAAHLLGLVQAPPCDAREAALTAADD